MKKIVWIALLFMITGIVVVGVVLFNRYFSPDGRTRQVLSFIRNPASHPEWVIPALTRCGDAPFLMPTSGMIGFLWDDSFRPGHHHQGIDIFAGTGVGETAVYAAFDGYLTRNVDWKSSLILRVPSDPINPGQQIWLYYTHLAGPEGNSLIDPAFPPGATEVFVSAGTPLGTQGNYSGTPGNPTGVHLHFSIVQDDGQGGYRNEMQIRNTLDPSPYFNLPLNAKQNPDTIPVCDQP
jgi:murein DD-endopeptidase MepM/ murein hydrolase activator NlpD